ncbi:unnamed protein product [Didymodactylos carnosus]|uniref:Uncharacterized protein n=1 Tax=Didymodactylos carnosus TaxID=1234261 RepID=A0A814SF76_9BILA|nr:unnamed protein product [Didymodactylos carnosus]CAF3907795.1 unnamed protein product [Didymodactylos carnosus]
MIRDSTDNDDYEDSIIRQSRQSTIMERDEVRSPTETKAIETTEFKKRNLFIFLIIGLTLLIAGEGFLAYKIGLFAGEPLNIFYTTMIDGVPEKYTTTSNDNEVELLDNSTANIVDNTASTIDVQWTQSTIVTATTMDSTDKLPIQVPSCNNLSYQCGCRKGYCWTTCFDKFWCYSSNRSTRVLLKDANTHEHPRTPPN